VNNSYGRVKGVAAYSTRRLRNPGRPEEESDSSGIKERRRDRVRRSPHSGGTPIIYTLSGGETAHETRDVPVARGVCQAEGRKKSWQARNAAVATFTETQRKGT